ncbi:MAG: zf-HC2 domain-containing protein [Deltaproteobacteria bacterium]|nr:zf-HC2 domain-containing protein [Deltaproteobacteria bacterium]
MKCHAVQKLLPLHVGGDLPSMKLRLIDQHLAGCEQCASFARDMADDRSWLQESMIRDDAEMPFESPAVFRMHARVMDRIGAAPVGQTSRWAWRTSTTMGCLGVAALGLLAFTRMRASHTTPVAFTPAAPFATSVEQNTLSSDDNSAEGDWRRHWMRDSAPQTRPGPAQLQTARGALAAVRPKPIEIPSNSATVRIIWFGDVVPGRSL